MEKIILALTLIFSLVGCGNSSSGGGDSTPKSPTDTHADDSKAYETNLRNYREATQEWRDGKCLSLFATAKPPVCRIDQYPRINDQIARVTKAISLAEKVMGQGGSSLARDYERKNVARDVEILKNFLSSQKQSLNQIEASLETFEAKLKEIHAQRQAIGDQLKEYGCDFSQGNAGCLKAISSIEDLERSVKVRALSEQLGKTFNAEAAAYRSLPEPGVVYREPQGPSLETIVSTENSLSRLCEFGPLSILNAAMVDLKTVTDPFSLDTEKYLSELYKSVPRLNGCESSDFPEIRAQVTAIQKFKNAFSANASTLRSRAFDQIELSAVDYQSYDSKTAYAWSPKSKHALWIKVPITAGEKALSDFFGKLDPANNPAWKGRDRMLQRISELIQSFPLAPSGSPLHVGIGLDSRGLKWAETAIELGVTQKTLEQAQGLMSEVNELNRLLASPKISPHYAFEGDVNITVRVFAADMGCPTAGQNGMPIPIAFPAGSDLSHVNSCLNAIKFRYMKRP